MFFFLRQRCLSLDLSIFTSKLRCSRISTGVNNRKINTLIYEKFLTTNITLESVETSSYFGSVTKIPTETKETQKLLLK